MEKGTIEAGHDLNLASLKELGLTEGPCLTITVPLQHRENMAHENGLRLKSACQGAEAALAARGLGSAEVRQFVEPVLQIEADSLASFGTLVVFRSREFFRYYQVRQELAENMEVTDQFQILPLLRPMQEENRQFYILALSQKRVRVLRCTDHSVEEVPWGPSTPTSLTDWLNTRSPTSAPEHNAPNQSESGSTEGEFTSTADRDNVDQHLINFFHRVNDGVNELLHDESSPLVIAAVEHEASLYRTVNTYAHLAPHFVQGSPDGLKGGDLHARALEVVGEVFDEPMRKALQSYERLGGSDKVSTKVAPIVKAAFEGRISHLFLLEGASEIGRWDPATLKASTQGKGENLLNLAALQTLTHGGEVWITSAGNIPNGGPAAAILRY